MDKIPVGISSCLTGEKVRYDGGHKRNAYILDNLGRYFDFKPYCPEMGIGLGTPRKPIHLINQTQSIKCVEVGNPEKDFTQPLKNYAHQQSGSLQNICGYIFKKDSPSCGIEKVNVFQRNISKKQGVGIYADEIMRLYPGLPVEDEGRLCDPELQENFVQRIFIMYRWKQMLQAGPTLPGLLKFHSRHKLIIMSHGSYKELGHLLATANGKRIAEISDVYLVQLMMLLKNIATRNKHVNVLQHIQGYLKKQLNASDKAELTEIIEKYHQGLLPLKAPLTLLKHHFRNFPDPYIDESYYMNPPPEIVSLSGSSQG